MIKHARKTTRLKEYDYTQNGVYFVTVCVNKNMLSNTGVGAGPRARPNILDPKTRPNVFGNIVNNVMELNDTGRMIERVWVEIPKYYDGVDVDPYFIVMPDHFHGIVIIDHGGRAQGPARTRVLMMSLSDVIHRFKSLTTALYRHDMIKNNRVGFRGQLWHRSFYDRVVRNGKDYVMIRNYILNNPAQWDNDGDNPYA
jgi:REP element-mobilizing transposase RayT